MEPPYLLKWFEKETIAKDLKENSLKHLFWDQYSTSSTVPSQDVSRYEACFHYFQSECDSWSYGSAHNPGAIDTLGDIFDLVDLLRNHYHEALGSPLFFAFFATIRNDTRPRMTPSSTIDYHTPLAKRYQFCTKYSVYSSIYFAIRVWLMINVGTRGADVATFKSYISCPDHMSLSELVVQAFEECDPRNLLGRFIGRRKKWEWYGFWIGLCVFVLTIIFGIVQTTAAII
jgi:hypothetical protein